MIILVIIKSMKINREGRQKKKKELKAYHVPGTIVTALYSVVFNPYNI